MRHPANRKACAETVDKNHCTTFHAEDEEYFSKVAVLEHPDHGVPRRSHGRQVHRLRRVDQGLDRDPQQLIPTELAPDPPDPLNPEPGRHRYRGTTTMGSKEGTAWGLLGLRALLWLARRLPRRPGDDLRDRVLHHRPVHRRGRADVHDSRTTARPPQPRRTCASSAARCSSRHGDRAVHPHRGALRVLHGAGRAPRRLRHLPWRGAGAAVGVVPRQGLCLARRWCSPAVCSTASSERPPGTASRPSCSP